MLSKNPKFDLKLKYQRIFEIGIIISISLIILAFRFFPEIKSEAAPPPKPPEITKLDPSIMTGAKPLPPPPPKPVLLITENLDDDILPDIEIDGPDWDDYIPSENPPPLKEDTNEKIPPFRFVEEMPEIIGGFAALQKNVYYPEIAVRAGIEGKVILQTIIDKTGNVEDVKVVKGLKGGCSEAAIEAVWKTKFKPGFQRGKPVRVSISIPILFKLN